MTALFYLLIIVVVAVVCFILTDKGMTGPAAEWNWLVKLIIFFVAIVAIFHYVIPGVIPL